MTPCPAHCCQDTNKLLSVSRVLEFAQQIALGLNWLHHRGIIHRGLPYCAVARFPPSRMNASTDLKTANILMDKYNRLKICDFGLSHVKSQNYRDTGFYGVVGTPCYTAPEVIRKEKYGEARFVALGSWC
jgi:serine/threonine protein kinase